MALQYSELTGVYRSITGGTPELLPLNGVVEFIPSLGYVHAADGTVLHIPTVVGALADGMLSKDGQPYVRLLAPASPGLSSSRWHYTARFSLTSRDGAAVRIPDARFRPAPGRYPLNPFISIPSQQGAPATRGLSAYELAVSEGFRGTLPEWLASLRGTGTGTGIRITASAAEPPNPLPGDIWLDLS